MKGKMSGKMPAMSAHDGERKYMGKKAAKDMRSMRFQKQVADAMYRKMHEGK